MKEQKKPASELYQPRQRTFGDYSECVTLNISYSNVGKTTADMKINIIFGEQHKEVPGCWFRFGLRRSELCFKLAGAKMPHEKNLFNVPLAKWIVADIEIDNRDKTKSSKKNRAKGKVDLKLPSLEAEEENYSEKEYEGNQRRKFHETLLQVRVQGPDTEPVCIFEVQDTKRCILGGLFGEKMATVCFENGSFHGTARLQALNKDIVIVDGGGLIPNPPNIVIEKILKLVIGNSLRRDGYKRVFCQELINLPG